MQKLSFHASEVNVDKFAVVNKKREKKNLKKKSWTLEEKCPRFMKATLTKETELCLLVTGSAVSKRNIWRIVCGVTR